jgi:signal transduction histidine kinase
MRRRDLSTRDASVLLGLGLVATVVTAWTGASSAILRDAGVTATLRAAVVATFTLAGVFTWRHRPRDTFGPIMVVLGLTYALTDPITSSDPYLHTLGRVANAGWVVLWVYAFLSFPSGRLGSRRQSRLFGAFAVAALVPWVAVVLLAEQMPSAGAFTACGTECPDNGFKAFDVSHGLAHAPVAFVGAFTALGLLTAAVVLLRRTLSAVGVERRTVAPVLLPVLAILISYVLYSRNPTGGHWFHVNLAIGGVASLSVPVAFVLGPLLGELFVSRGLWRGLSGFDYQRTTHEQVEELARRALGDRSLRLAEVGQATGELGDLDGVRIASLEGGTVALTPIFRPGGSFVIIHNPVLARGYTGLVQRVGELAFTIVERGRLLRDLVFSRRRIAEAEGEERVQLEKDLHDGAQQHLLTIQVKLAQLARGLGGNVLEREVNDLSTTAAAAVAELRRLAHGIYPPILAQSGVAAALRGVPVPPPLRVRIEDEGIGRLGATTERALYFAACEAIQNATKHAEASSVVVTLRRDGDDGAEVEIVDDGHGFATTAVAEGTGLTGMRDRIESVGGHLEVESAPGEGTRVRLVVRRA